MARVERIRIEINESTTGDNRTFNIAVAMPADDFQLTDILKQRGVIDGLEVELKKAIKEATDGYIKSAETLISSLTSNTNSKRRSHGNSTSSDKPRESVSVSSTSTR